MDKKKDEHERDQYTSEKTAENTETENNQSLYKDIKRKEEEVKKGTIGGF